MNQFKKAIIIIIGLMLIICSLIAIIFKPKNTSKENKNLVLAEVTHSVFYTPLYVAIENGYFKEEGIDLELILTPGADKVSAAVLSNDANIGFAGAESAMYIYNSDEKDYLQIFSGLTKRDGQFIVSRNKDNFDWKSLKGKEILAGRSSGMPALNFLNALKNAGIDKDEVKINTSIEFASLSGAFIGGQGDFVNLFEPNATLLEQEKLGYVVESVGKLSGEFPYTVFYARKSFIENNKELLKRFSKAIGKGLEYTINNDSVNIANVIKEQFPDTDTDLLAKMIKRYKENDCWLQTPVVTEKLHNNLNNFLIENKLLDTTIPYNELVINL